MNEIATIKPNKQPKPSQAEIIEAMAILKRDELLSERTRKQAAADAAVDAATVALTNYVIEHSSECTYKISFGWADDMTGTTLDVSFGHSLPKYLLKHVANARKLLAEVPREPSMDRLRKEIKEALRPDVSRRAVGLLDNSEMRSALEKTLKALEGK